MEENQEQLDPLTKKAKGLVVVGNIVLISSSYYKKLNGKYVISEVYEKDNLVIVKKMGTKGQSHETHYWTFIEDTKRFLSENINYFRIYKPNPLKKSNNADGSVNINNNLRTTPFVEEIFYDAYYDDEFLTDSDNR